MKNYLHSLALALALALAVSVASPAMAVPRPAPMVATNVLPAPVSEWIFIVTGSDGSHLLGKKKSATVSRSSSGLPFVRSTFAFVGPDGKVEPFMAATPIQACADQSGEVAIGELDGTGIRKYSWSVKGSMMHDVIAQSLCWAAEAILINEAFTPLKEI
jgi:hypothetical protein